MLDAVWVLREEVDGKTGTMGPVLGPSGAVLGASWGCLGPSWIVLGGPGGRHGASWGRLPRPRICVPVNIHYRDAIVRDWYQFQTPRGPLRKGLLEPRLAPQAAMSLTEIGPMHDRISTEGPKKPQDRPKSPQDGPERPQDGPKRLQDGPKRPQDGPKKPQDGPKRPQDGPQDKPKRPKTGPRGPKTGPRSPGTAPRRSKTVRKRPKKYFNPVFVPRKPPLISFRVSKASA